MHLVSTSRSRNAAVRLLGLFILLAFAYFPSSSFAQPHVGINVPEFRGSAGGDTVCRDIAIINGNNFSVSFQNIQFYPMGNWSVPGLTLPLQIPAGDTVYIEVCYTADTLFAHTDSIAFHFDGGGTKWVDVRPVSVNEQQCFTVTPLNLAFDYVHVGTWDSVSFTLKNLTDETITLDAVDFGGEEKNTLTFPGLPATLDPHEERTVYARIDVDEAGYAYKTWKIARTDEACGAIGMTSWVVGDPIGCFEVHWDSTQLAPLFLGDDTTITLTFVNTTDHEISIEPYTSQTDPRINHEWSANWPITLDAGDSLAVDLRITAIDVGHYYLMYTFYSASDSETCNMYFVPNSGTVISNSAIPQIEIFSDDIIEFETTLPSLERPFVLVNDSKSAVEVTKLELAQGTHFEMIKMPILPEMLLVDEGLLTRIVFEGKSAGLYFDTLLVSMSNNVVERIPVRGNLVAGSVSEANNTVMVEAWPNPATTQLNVSVSNARSAMLSITDMLGRTVYYGVADSSATIDLRSLSLSAGSYIVRISGTAVSGAPFVQSTMITVQ